jgi:hypothetical protein
MMRKPPRFTHGYVDRHGKPRWYLRRRGFKSIPLAGLPWSPEFMAAYEAALAGQGPRQEIGASRTKPGSISTLIVKFYRSGEWAGLAKSTQVTYRGILERFRVEHGHRLVADLAREYVRAIIAKKSATPQAANNLRKMIRLLMRFAVEEGWRRDDPTLEVKAIKVRSEGFYTWTEDDIAAFREALACQHKTAARYGARPLYRATALRPRSDGQAAHSQWTHSDYATKDADKAGDSDSPRAASGARFHTLRAPNILDDCLRTTVYASRFWRLV